MQIYTATVHFKLSKRKKVIENKWAVAVYIFPWKTT